MPQKTMTLSARILLATLGIIAMTMLVGLALYSTLTSKDNDDRAAELARSIAVTLGNAPGVAEAVVAGDPQHLLPALGERVQRDSGASYVVIIDRSGIRYSHPNPALIGQRIEEPVVALDGIVRTGVEAGSLGRSANARAPIVDAGEHPVGEVSVGILESEVGIRLSQQMSSIALYTLGRSGSVSWRRSCSRGRSPGPRSTCNRRRSSPSCRNGRPCCTGSARASWRSTSAAGSTS